MCISLKLYKIKCENIASIIFIPKNHQYRFRMNKIHISILADSMNYKGHPGITE